MGDARLEEALELAAGHAREQQRLLDTAERLLAEERSARRADLEAVLRALGQDPPADVDVRLLARDAADAARVLRADAERLRSER